MGARLGSRSAIGGDDPHQVLAGWLDDYAANKCHRDDVREIFSSVSRSATEAPWTALALLDQYQRLGRIDQSLASELKTVVNQVVFGAVMPPTPAQPIPAAPEPVVTATEQVHASDQAHENSQDAATAAAAKHSQDAGPTLENTHRILRQRYELAELTGRNGTGSTYRALDHQRDNLPQSSRYVAIKLASLDAANSSTSSQDIQRGFYRAQSLNHPNIRRVSDVGIDGDECFAVMEMLYGERLSTLLENLNGRLLPWHYARNVLRGIGAALVYAHDHGIVHENLQPSNVMITETGEIKVLEFGFSAAPRREPWVSDGASSPRSDPLGHPAHREDQAAELAEQSGDDVFSFACIAFELISGRHPYGKRSALSAVTRGHQPVRSIHFNQRQWRVLRRALASTRDHQKISIQQLLEGLGCDQPPQPLPSLYSMLTGDVKDHSWLKPALIVIAVLMLAALGAYALFRSQSAVPAQHTEASAATNNTPSSTESTDLVTAPPPPLSAEAITTPPVTSAEVIVDDAVVDTEPHTTSDVSPPVNEKRGTVKSSVVFSQDSFVVSEGERAAKILIRRTGDVDRPLRVRWSADGGSAKPGDDFADLSGSVEIPAGSDQYALVIPLASDSVKEGTEFFTVKLHAIDNSPLSGRMTTSVIVVDDD